MNNEPVAWMEIEEGGITEYKVWREPVSSKSIPLYTHPAKTLTNEEILCLWDWWSGEILSTDILDFADTYKRALLGEEGLVEWHQEYVKKMNKEHDLGIAEAIGFDKGYEAATAKTLTDEEIHDLIVNKVTDYDMIKKALRKAQEK